jgi:hypothetical protein
MRVDNAFASKRPYFGPWQETRKPPVSPYRINSGLGTFDFGGFLLALAGDTSVNGTTVAVETYPDSSMSPFQQIRLTETCTDWYAYCSDAPLQVSIPGIWGFNRDYENAWLQVDTLKLAIGDTVIKTFTVNDVAGPDDYGQTPAISAGDLLRIDDEYLEVISTDNGTDIVTMRRHANGSTAAEHVVDTPVYRWQTEEPVKYAVARQVGLMYSRRGAYVTVETNGLSEVRYPSDWLSEVKAILAEYT